MNRIRGVLPWRKSKYNGDSDYCTSSETSRALSDSQFILRPNTVLLSSYSNATNYYALDSTESVPPRNKNDGGGGNSTISSRSSRRSTISSTTMKSVEMTLSESADDEEESTIKGTPLRNVPMLPTLTSIKHLMTQTPIDDMETLDEITFDDVDDDDDLLPPPLPCGQNREFKNSTFRSFPFSYRINDSEMGELFARLGMDEPSTSSSVDQTTVRKRLHIKEPDFKIYYHDESFFSSPSSSNSPPPKPVLSRAESAPRSILKNCSSFPVYEEIYGDHLSPPPVDIRPKLPDRPPTVLSPTTTTTTSRYAHRLPSIRRKKKLPSLHHSTSFASYFRRRK
ncbi:unnamed protein product [Caenorhabditis bovis]|uniref:Uncharacterized protein n=1 Tax=Caenorhabditis bovis TaxID=2654633 RepID=A0A8S1F6B2_9PELO|nr:unnamed protein product [Caenorhabditis bovis]